MAKLGHTVLLQDALRTHNPNTCERDPDTESTALHWAIRTNNLEIARILLEAGSSTNEVDDHKRTPLHIAAYTRNYEATVLLLEYKADPNTRDSWDNTPLLSAQSWELYFIAVRLLEAGATIQEGLLLQEIFCAAVQIAVISVAKLLVNRVDLEGRNARGQTVLELANASADDALLEWLRQLIYTPTDRRSLRVEELQTGDHDQT